MDIQTWRVVCASLIVVIYIPKISQATCQSGRLYFGNFNETYEDKVVLMGIYEKIPNLVHHNKPVYKHQTQHEYLYFFQVKVLDMMLSAWVIGPVPGGQDEVDVTIRSTADEPQDAEGVWKIRHDGEKISDPSVKLICTDGSSFTSCTSTKLVVDGLKKTTKQLHLMGTYMLQNEIVQSRPVYRHTSRNEELFYHNGFWMIGNKTGYGGQVSAGMFVQDYALRPELITESWHVFNGQYIVKDSDVHISCQPNTETEEDSNVVSLDDISVCDNWPCLNGGRCALVAGSLKDYLCLCPEGFFGAHCETNIECSSPPVISEATLTSLTSHGFLGLAFYQCEHAYSLTGSETPAICGYDATWHQLPECTGHQPGILPDLLDYANAIDIPETYQGENT